MTATVAAPAGLEVDSADLVVRQIAIDLIDPCPVNPRKKMDIDQIAELAQSIKEMGVTNPVSLRLGWSPVQAEGEVGEQRYELISGHRRLEASKRAGRTHIPSIVRSLTDSEALDLAIVDNLQRVDLSPMEEADGYRTLLKVMGASPDDMQACAQEIALKVGKTVPYVIQRLKLLSLIPEAADALRGGVLSLTLALLIAKLQPADQDPALIEALDPKKIMRGEKTLFAFVERATKRLLENAGYARLATERELRDWIEDNVILALKSAPFALDDASLVPEAGSCVACPKRSGSNAALFGDLTAKEDTCTDPECFNAKKKAFVKLTVKLSVEDGKQLLKLSTSSSTLAIKEGSELNKTTFKQGQWVPAKKGECQDTYRGITQDGELKTVCVNQKCKVHKHQVTKPGARNEAFDSKEHKRKEEARRELGEFLAKTETPIRVKIWLAILAKLDRASAIRAVNGEDSSAPGNRKELLKDFPKLDGEMLEAMVVFTSTFRQFARPNAYWISQENGVAGNRKKLWELATRFGVDANAITAKHFHDAGTIAPAADVLYPKGIPWPKQSASKVVPPSEGKEVAEKRQSTKKGASSQKRSSSKPAAKGQKAKPSRLTPEARKRIADALKKRFAAARKGGKR